MHASRLLMVVLLGTIFISATAFTAGAAQTWLATGIVVKIDGNTLFFLGKDNTIYRVDMSGAEMVSPERELRPGLSVRVFGVQTGPEAVRASRIRIMTPDAAAPSTTTGQREVRIVVDKDAQAVVEAPSVITEDRELPMAIDPESLTWQGKGLITEIDFVGHQVKIQTSDGPFTVNIDNAVMVRGTVRVGLARLNQGDTIWVAGNEVAPFVVDGRMVRVLRTASEAQNATPTLPVSVVGVILQIDYPSRTFRMTGRSTVAVVSCDDNTVIQFQSLKKGFADLTPGTKVNMSGYGNLNTGYAAHHIQIIAVSP